MRALITPIFLVLVLSGCALFQKPIQPETPKQSLAVAEITYQGMLDAVNQLIDAGQVSSDQATDLIVDLTRIKTSLDAARIYLSSGADTEAERTLIVLNGLIAVLSERIREMQNESEQS